MSRATAAISQTLGHSDSEIELMADFKDAPGTPFWEVPGFLFEAETVEDIEKYKKKVWKALICPDYTSVPSSNNAQPEEIIKIRVRNNVALLFRALLFFSDFYSTPSYWIHLSPDTFSGSGDTIIKVLESIFVQARRAYVGSNGARTSSNIALYADRYIRFLDSAEQDRISSALTKTELRDNWAELKKKGALYNLAQHRPNDVEDDGSDDELLTLPGERIRNTGSRKRKNLTSAPVTPRRSKRPSTSSVRRSTRTVRVISPSSSPPIPRFDSAVGLSSDFSPVSNTDSVSSPIFSPDTPSALTSRNAQREPLKNISERLRSMDLEISKQRATLAKHSTSIESLKTDISLQQRGRRPAELAATVESAIGRIESLEGKKHVYTTRVVNARLSVVKANQDEKLAALDSKLQDCVGRIAVEESQRKDIKITLDKLNIRQDKLRDAVKRHRGDHKKLARDVGRRLENLEENVNNAGRDGSAGAEEDEDHHHHADSDKSRVAVFEEELASLKQTSKKLHRRVFFLEKAPSLDVIQQDGVALKARVKALEEENLQLRNNLNKTSNQIKGLVDAKVMEAIKNFEERQRGNEERQRHDSPQRQNSHHTGGQSNRGPGGGRGRHVQDMGHQIRGSSMR